MTIQVKKTKDGSVELRNSQGQTIVTLSREQARSLAEVLIAAAKDVFFFFLMLQSVSAQTAHYRKHDSVLLNDPKETPGKTVSITQEKLCSTKWGKDERHVTAEMKDQVCVAYGLKPHCYGRATNEIDHLISRELGGADEVKNLWPQSYQGIGAHQKDALENWMHKQVCSGKMPLSEAQWRISNDWYAEYLKMKAAK